MTTTITPESFANCKRDAVNYAIKDALGLDETANLRKRLIQLATKAEDGEDEEIDPQIGLYIAGVPVGECIFEH